MRMNLSNKLYNVHLIRIIFFMIIWYIFSFTTLFLNKYILSNLNGNPILLGCFQLILCSFGGYFHLKYPSFTSDIRNDQDLKFHNFSRGLIIIGCLRLSTLILGLIALWYVPVSFAETVKSSAPVFTVIISRILLGEKTSLLINLSLIPVMGGLAICSVYEISFTLTGLLVSIATNLSECLQNVYSKKLLRNYDPPSIQFYSSVSSIFLQIPSILLMVNFSHLWDLISSDSNILLAFILNGISFHVQSITEYFLLTYISPVTHSVANTVKRALLIWLSVLIYGNPVTYLSWIGTSIIILGVLIYNKSRSYVEKISPNQLCEKINLHTV